MIAMARRLHDFEDLGAVVQERRPRIALILGSGLGDLADRLSDVVELPFGAIFGLHTPSVAGHRGVLLHGMWCGLPLLVFAGRLHFYEGHPWRTVVQPIHIAHELGASVLITTCAAGGIRSDLQPGDLMAIRAHHNCARDDWWRDEVAARGMAEPATPQAAVYSPRLLKLLNLPTGVYAQVTGPCYETRAEIRALRSFGVDAVGMSTAREIEAGHALGMECAGIACITNKAAGLGSGPISHEEVLLAGDKVRDRMIGTLERIVTSA
jgi:purine-nucleoside phosphorylase